MRFKPTESASLNIDNKNTESANSDIPIEKDGEKSSFSSDIYTNDLYYEYIQGKQSDNVLQYPVLLNDSDTSERFRKEIGGNRI